jgi:hypothetical protein
MTAQEVLTKVRERGVVLVLIDGRLKASPPGLLPPDLKTAIRDRSDEIKALLPIEQERNRWPGDSRAPMPLNRCGALACRTCGAHSPSTHRGDCTFPRFHPCLSRWHWLSPTARLSASRAPLRPALSWSKDGSWPASRTAASPERFSLCSTSRARRSEPLSPSSSKGLSRNRVIGSAEVCYILASIRVSSCQLREAYSLEWPIR